MNLVVLNNEVVQFFLKQSHNLLKQKFDYKLNLLSVSIFTETSHFYLSENYMIKNVIATFICVLK